jgi:hypothetical protein
MEGKWVGERSMYRVVKNSVETRDNIFIESCKYLYLLLIWNINLLKAAGYVMHHQFNIQQLYSLPTLYLCVLYLSENKQRLVPLTA